MTWEIGLLFALLAGMVYLFLTEKLPVDLTAFCGLVILTLTGYVTKDEAFVGFASPAVITMLSIFIVSAAMLQTGIADMVGGRIHSLVGSREVPLIISIMVVAGVLSAFMNNIAATAVLMPAVASLARHAGLSPSRLFMPLAFGAILGGTTTMVGTPPNILAAAMLEERGMEPFALFDFTPMGLVILGTGVLFMVTFGRRLLPERQSGAPASEGKDLAKVYRVQERAFSLRIPEGSPLNGQSLRDSRLGSALHIQVVAIERDGKRILAPRADTEIRVGDRFLVKGTRRDVESLFQVSGVEVQEMASDALPRPIRGVGGIRMALAPGSPMIGRTLRQIGFRERYGLVVVAIERDGKLHRDSLGEIPLNQSDEILAMGSRGELETLVADADFEVHQIGLSAVQELQQYLSLIRVPEISPMVGSTIALSRLGELVGLTVSGIIRGGETHLAVSPHEEIQAGDRLIVAGDPERLEQLIDLGHVDLIDLDSEQAEDFLESGSVGVVEAAIAPRSSLVGKTLGELDFRQRYGLQTLAIWREGEPIHTNLARLALRFGDALFLQGSREKIRLLSKDPDFVVLSQKVEMERRTKKAPFAVLGLLLMVGMVIAGFQPIHVAAFTAATLVVLSGAVTMEEAYRAIEWRAIFLVAAVLPVGAAMERTGAAQLLAGSVTALGEPLGPYGVLAGLVVLSSLLSQGLDGAPAVVLLTPVVLQASQDLGLSPYPMMMGISLAASAAFMTPFSHKANLLVMGAGGYKAMDYLRVGTVLTVVLLAMMVLLIPIFFPF